MVRISLLLSLCGFLSLSNFIAPNSSSQDTVPGVEDLDDGWVEMHGTGKSQDDPLQDMKDAAYASRLVYKDLDRELVPEPYEVIYHSKDLDDGPQAHEFKGLVLRNGNSKKIFVAFQGTKKKDVKFLLQDLAVMTADKDRMRKYMVDYWTKSGFFDDLSWKGALMNLLSIFDVTGFVDAYMPDWMSDLSKKGNKVVSAAGDPEKMMIDGVVNALKFFDEAQKVIDQNYQGEKIIVTGHSLGGFQAQIVSTLKGIPAFAFNAPAAKEIFESHKGKIKDALGSKESFKSFNENKVTMVTRRGDIIGYFGDFKGKRIVYPAYASRDSVDGPASFTAFLMDNHSMNNFASAILGGLEEEHGEDDE